MVLARDEVQRAAHQPGDQQRSAGERGVDVAGARRGAAGAQRERHRPRVLRLDREEMRDRGLRLARPAAREQLRGGAPAAQLGRRHSAIRMR